MNIANKHYRARKGLKTPTYLAWIEMRRRCLKPTNKNFSYYGGRGISICGRWSDFGEFLSDMGEKPPRLSLERIDNNRGYEPSNCKWATHSEQMKNRRRFNRNGLIK